MYIPNAMKIDYTRENKHWIANNFDKLGLGRTQKVGNIMGYFHKYKPTTLKEAFNIWLKCHPNAKDIFVDLFEIVKKYEPKFSDKRIRDILIIGLFWNSFLGYSAEEEWLKQNPQYEKSTKEYDEQYAIDFIKKENNNIVDAIQLKSENSRKNNKSNYRIRNWKKNVKFFEKWGIEPEEVYYVWEWDYKNNKFNFKYV